MDEKEIFEKYSKFTKPLPKHTKLKYCECYAKVVLEHLFPKYLLGLVIEDKPDLMTPDRKCGIEVTNAYEQDFLKITGIMTDLNYGRCRNPEDAIKALEDCGAKYVDNMIIHPTYKDSFEEIIQALTIKLTRLNKDDFRKFETNCIFIESSIFADDRMLTQALLDICKLSDTYEYRFDYIFVAVPGSMYVFDIEKKNYHILPIADRDQSKLAALARIMVEDSK